MLRKIRHYLIEELWNFPLREKTGWRHFSFKTLRVAVLALRGFFQDQCILHASSLTYYSIMATVPILAISFAIARGFGFHDFLRERILYHFEQTQEPFLHHVLTFVDRMIEHVKGGVIAGMGLVILFWSITQLLSNLESSMNHIWKVKKLRSWRRIFSDYFALMLIGPCLFFLSASTSVFFVKAVSAGLHALYFSPWLFNILLFIAQLVPYCLFWFFFTFIYLLMPNQRVPISSAFLGGVIGGTIYLIVQWGYIYFQIAFNRIGAIYGSFAAFPLFLIWVQVSWFIFLFGAEISFAHQTLDIHEYEEQSKRASVRYRRLLSLWLTHLAISKFITGGTLLTRQAVMVHHQIPYALAIPILDDLITSGLFLETAEGLVPVKPTESLRISDVLLALETKGISNFPFIDAEQLKPFEHVLDAFRAQMEASVDNQLVSQVASRCF